MSKYKNFQDVKIIKKCEKKEENVENQNCESFNFENENFLDNVDDEILFVDSSIIIDGEIVKKVESKTTESKSLINSKTSITSTSPDCFSETPQRLNEQMKLPITNIEQLSFYETFIISENSTRSSLPIVPKIEDIVEIGSSCVLVEELEDGKVLIFTTQQMFIDGERNVIETISVITKDLKLINEKRIERKCRENKSSKVRYF